MTYEIKVWWSVLKWGKGMLNFYISKITPWFVYLDCPFFYNIDMKRLRYIFDGLYIAGLTIFYFFSVIGIGIYIGIKNLFNKE